MRLYRAFWPLTLSLLLLMGTIQVLTALEETQNWDEGIHIFAGYANWKGDYRWNREHPPLVKMLATLPLLPLRPKLPAAPKSWSDLDQTRIGIDFLYANVVSAETLLFRARLFPILLTLCGGLLLALWTRRRFGAAAALIALAFYVFDPNLIAHGRYVTTDVPLAVFFLLTCVAWTEALLSGRFRHLLLASLCLGLALVVKFSAVLLIPVIVMLYGIAWAQRPAEFPLRRALLTAVTATAISATVISGVYWRETVRHVRSPVPETPWQHAWFAGLDHVMTHNAGGHPTYLLGTTSRRGVWYYFPVVFGVKSTTATLLASLLLAGAGLVRLRRLRRLPFALIGILLPLVFYVAFSMTSGINLGVRHLLPAYPLLCVALAVFLTSLEGRTRLALVSLLLTLHIAESLAIYPDYLAFFNRISGGPEAGPRYLADSNIDWGQDLLKLKKWLAVRGTNSVYLNYFGNASAPYFGLDERALPPPSDQDGWDKLDGFVACSVTQLIGVYSPPEETARLRALTPVAKVGYSIYVYDLRRTK